MGLEAPAHVGPLGLQFRTRYVDSSLDGPFGLRAGDVGRVNGDAAIAFGEQVKQFLGMNLGCGTNPQEQAEHDE